MSEINARMAVPLASAIGGAAFNGTLQVQRFAPQDGGLAAIGLVTGTMRSTTGATSLARTVRLPALVTAAATDHAVHLDFGPVSVDVLWWRMDFGRIVLDVASQDGDGSVDLVRRELERQAPEPTRLARLLNGLLGLPR